MFKKKPLTFCHINVKSLQANIKLVKWEQNPKRNGLKQAQQNMLQLALLALHFYKLKNSPHQHLSQFSPGNALFQVPILFLSSMSKKVKQCAIQIFTGRANVQNGCLFSVWSVSVDFIL